MILVDANLLLYAVNRDVPQHETARRWLENALRGSETLAFTWIVLLAFLRISTRSSIFEKPLAPERALGFVDEWLAMPPATLLAPGDRHWQILRGVLQRAGTAGNLTSDAHLAALALEYGAAVYSADYDFRRFAGVTHVDPLADAPS